MPRSNNINGSFSSYLIQGENNDQSKEPVGQWGTQDLKKVEVGKKEVVTKGSGFKTKSRKDRTIEALDQIRLTAKSDMVFLKVYNPVETDDFRGIGDSLAWKFNTNLTGKLTDRNKEVHKLGILQGELVDVQDKINDFKKKRSDILNVYNKVYSRFKRKWSKGHKIKIPTAEVGKKVEYQVVSSSSKVNKKKLREYLDKSDVGVLYKEHLNNKNERRLIKKKIAKAKKALSLINKQSISLYIQERRNCFEEQKKNISSLSKSYMNTDIANFKKLLNGRLGNVFKPAQPANEVNQENIESNNNKNQNKETK